MSSFEYQLHSGCLEKSNRNEPGTKTPKTNEQREPKEGLTAGMGMILCMNGVKKSNELLVIFLGGIKMLALDIKKNFCVTYSDFNICFTSDNTKIPLEMKLR